MSLHVKHIPPTGVEAMRRRAEGGLYVRARTTTASVALIVLAAATTFLGFAVLTFLPVFAQQIFHEGAEHLQPPDGVFGRRLDRRRAAWSRGSGRFKRMGLTALLVQAVYGALIIAFALSRVAAG